ncbi:MAG TPA: Rrf2 family transcriptional regulator [Chthoniobacterales bacterium]
MRSCRFVFAVHVLAVLATRQPSSCSSIALAQTVNTNPVVIRRLLIDLQAAGLIGTIRGPRGGAYLAMPPDQITLFEVRCAVDPPTAFGLHPQSPAPSCPVGGRIRAVMKQVQDQVLGAMERELTGITLADVVCRLQACADPRP